MDKKTNFDVIIIGAGPAGLIAGGVSALNGNQTVILEKMDQPGRKLRITGKGRCNFTNDIDLDTFISHFGANGNFLRQAFHRFFVKDLINFFDAIGIESVVERGGRVFPGNGDASFLTEKLAAWATSSVAEIRPQTSVEKILSNDGIIEGIQTRNGERINAPSIVLACGGASFTGTGSTGDGYAMAKALGHHITPLRPALVPIRSEDPRTRELQGLALRNVRATILVNGTQTREAFGELMFTHFGLSGPVILTMSGYIVDELQAGKSVEISIDLKPALDEKKLDNRLLREFDTSGKTHFQNILKSLLPSKMIPVCVTDTRIPAHKPGHQITQEERSHLLHWLKDLRFKISGHLPIEAAMITQGGVSLDAVDPRTMESKLVKGLYFAGEILDLAADTGGFNLQAAFSTGYVAGENAAKFVTGVSR